MDAVSYPDKSVADFLSEKVVPLRVQADQPLADQFKVTWTPTLVILDPQGVEHNRTVGFLPPPDLVASVMLGMGKAAFDNGEYDKAVMHFNTLTSLYPNSPSAPEAIFMRGVAKFKTNHDAKALKEVYEQLNSQFPNTEWANRAQPYRLL